MRPGRVDEHRRPLHDGLGQLPGVLQSFERQPIHGERFRNEIFNRDFGRSPSIKNVRGQIADGSANLRIVGADIEERALFDRGRNHRERRDPGALGGSDHRIGSHHHRDVATQPDCFHTTCGERVGRLQNGTGAFRIGLYQSHAEHGANGARQSSLRLGIGFRWIPDQSDRLEFRPHLFGHSERFLLGLHRAVAREVGRVIQVIGPIDADPGAVRVGNQSEHVRDLRTEFVGIGHSLQ